MPSKTPKQAKFMRAVAHGWTPSRMKSPPSRAVAREFVEADRKYSGGFAENRYARGGLAFMNEVDSNSERARPLRGFQFGGTAGIAGMYRRAREMAEGSQDPEESPYGTEAGTTQQMLDRMGWSGPMGYLKLTSGLRQAGWTPASGSGDEDLANRMWYPPEGTLTGGDGEGGPPPRIIPTDPASYIGVSAEEKEALKESPYRDQLREHKAKIAATLGSARGGHVNYYQAGGAVRPGHAEDATKGPNPHKAGTAAYNYWETRFHKEPEPPPEVVEEVPEDIPWYKRIAGYGSEEEAAKVDEVVTGAQTGQAYGGRVGYQLGGLAIAAPAGGVPPWISPTGSGPGYMEEEVPGYQFGGIANRFNPPTAAPPPAAAPPQGQIMNQAQSAFNAQTGGPRGGVMGGQYRGVPPQRGMISRGAQPGGLAAMLQQARQQQAGASGRGPSRFGPGEGELMRRTQGDYLDRMNRQLPGADRFGNSPELRRQHEEARDAYRDTGMQGNVHDFMAENYPDLQEMRNTTIYDGGDWQNPNIGRPGYDQIGDMGPITGPGTRPWKQRNRIAPPPGKYPGGSGPYNPGPVGPGGPPTETTMPVGGPRVPPNMQGFLQKQRMMNRPPANVGGGANRVGMQDQQGALSRAMQRGTGRAPPSRRFGRGRAGRGRGFEAQ